MMQPSFDMQVRMAELLNVNPRQLINGGNIKIKIMKDILSYESDI